MFRDHLPLIVTVLSALTAATALSACDTTITPFDDDGAVCAGFEDTTQTTDVAVTVRNDGASPIYITGLGCDASVDLRLYDANDQLLAYRERVCQFTCSELQETDAVCAADCALPPVVMIAPGGTYELAWNGTVLDAVGMPPGCYLSPDLAGDTCEQRVVAPAGEYALEITAYDGSFCPLDMEGACECEPDATGSCTVDIYMEVSGEGRTGRTALSFPAEDRAEIVFD